LTKLAIDIGNTRIKAGVFENNILQTVFRFENLEGLKLYCDELDAETPLIISSVTNDNLTAFHQYFTNLIVLDYRTKIPITNQYKTPETLGNDRLAAVIGAFSVYHGFNNLVVDIGTCIKYDFIDKNGIYNGGSISPGLDIKFKALNQFTGKLPLVQKSYNYNALGDNTENALISGVMFGTCSEIQGFINNYSDLNDNLNIILTGGDAPYFANKLKGTIFAEPDLVVKGLFEILNYNAPNP
jgi:type III pantothenate kinase